jgi:molecular chaperone DnaK
VSSEDKLEVENKIETLREALKGSDMEAVKAGMSSLAESLQRVSTAAYQAAASAAGESGNGSSDGTGDGADGAGPDGAEGAEGEAEEETVEGEFKEV